MKIFNGFALFSFIFVLGCAMSPGREIIKKDSARINVSLGGALMDQVTFLEWLPLPINLSVGGAYGIADNLTVGGNLYLLPLIGGNLLIEPYGVYNLYRSGSSNFDVNLYADIPLDFTFIKEFDFNSYPIIGLVPISYDNLFSSYVVLEIGTDFKNFPSVQLNLKIGGSYKAFSTTTLEGEVGLIHIGEISAVSQFSKIGIGIPVFTFGASFNVK